MRSARNGLTLIAVAGVLMTAGCSGVGPPTVARDRFDYNGEVARSWFWIDDRDAASKATFSLVMLLSTLAETGPRETPPLLAIPAG